MSRTQREMEQLHAYHDGELSWLARRRMARRLERDPGARRELEGLREMRSLLEELDGESAAPDLWESVRMRLPAEDLRRREAVAAEREPSRLLATPRLVGATVAACVATLALAVGLNLSDPSDTGAVRWLDSHGAPVLVLEDNREATIIWLLDGAQETTSRRSVSVFS